MRILLCFFSLLMVGCSRDLSQPSLDSESMTITVIDLNGEASTMNLAANSTIQDLLNQIQCEDCDLTRLNPLTKLYTNDVVVLYPKHDKCVSINQGTLDELDSLSGIGPSIAQRILDYRQAYGLFQSLDEIMLVKGIKEKLFEKIKLQICL